ncbi:MAG TPA: peptidoglycan -binding protein [Stellaceae bacterium]|jgi:chemotaxis protein MotB|nr:peptidoglycan -binding protein [Stellaceae bacterium]
MAYVSRRQRRPGIDIWPGFVDALSQLVMVIVFVLLVFTAGQFYLTDALSGRDAALQRLSQQINQLADMLSLAQSGNTDLQSRLSALSQQLAAANQALAQVRDQNAQLQQQASSSDQRATTAETTVDQLNQNIAALRDQLQQIAAALDLSDAKNKDQAAQIADLGQRLNTALLSQVQQLAKYRSEFFGRLREALGNRPDIQIVGDRFVFQSEVLFPLASAQLSDAAKQRLAVVAAALKDIATQIPVDIPWVLAVNGYTDKRPINTPQFPSNWELSAARAISVINYLISQGVPADRLAAAGFAEHDPIDPGDSEDAYSRNRRIELKLTER